MDRSAISHLAHAGHPIAAPLDDAAVQGLLRRALAGTLGFVTLVLRRAERSDPTGQRSP